MSLLAWMLVGGLAAAVVGALTGGRAWEFGAWAVGLALVALVYPALAVGQDLGGTAGRELVAALPWLLAAGLAKRFGLLFLAVAWALHGVLDLFPAGRAWMPAFYPPLCAGFGLGAAIRLLRTRYGA